MQYEETCPLSKSEAMDLYFLEHRAKLLDVAAFLDRVERAAADAGDSEDFRLEAFRDAIKVIADGNRNRARRVLETFSDPTSDAIPAAGTKGATGAWPDRPAAG